MPNWHIGGIEMINAKYYEKMHGYSWLNQKKGIVE
jgi:hypothetical protein